MTPDELRSALDDLGAERAKRDADDKDLAERIEKTLGEAYGAISVAEAARRLGMARTTVYRVYEPHAARG